MNFYVLLYIILLCLTLCAYQGYDRKCFLFAATIVFLFIGLRAPVVGADTWNYYRFFIGERNFYNYDSRDLETLLVSYNKIFQVLFFKQGQLYILLNTFISFGALCLYIKKFSSFKTLSVLLFFLVCPYEIYFVALRQIIGISFLLVGFYFVLENKKNKWIMYGVFSILGWGFHTTTIVASIVFIFCYYVRIPSKIIGVSLVLVTALLGRVFNYFNITEIMNSFLLFNFSATERINNYLSDVVLIDRDFSNLFVLFKHSIISIITLLLIPIDKVKHIFTSIYIVGICIFNIFGDFYLIYRVILPFQIFSIIVISWIFTPYNIFYRRHRLYLNIFLSLFFLYLFRAGIITHVNYDKFADDKMHPYYFFFQDYRDHYTLKDPNYK